MCQGTRSKLFAFRLHCPVVVTFRVRRIPPRACRKRRRKRKRKRKRRRKQSGVKGYSASHLTPLTADAIDGAF